MLYFIIIVTIVTIISILICKYLDGHYTLHNVEEINSTTYHQKETDDYREHKRTITVFKYTYCDKHVKFKTKTYYH